MKEKFIENGIEYVRCGDYYIPNLSVPQNQYEIGKYGRMRLKYIKKMLLQLSYDNRELE